MKTVAAHIYIIYIYIYIYINIYIYKVCKAFTKLTKNTREEVLF